MAIDLRTADSVVEAYTDLPETEKTKAAEEIARTRAMPDPSGRAVNWLWLIVVSALAILLLGGTFLVFWLTKDGKDTEAILPLVAGALGALAGLLAPSPAVDR
jgi:flagellar basal body-associated protein FliL